MELEMNINVKEILLAVFLLLLPWVVILIGIAIPIQNVLPEGGASWYYVIAISWFGLGVIFFQALRG